MNIDLKRFTLHAAITMACVSTLMASTPVFAASNPDDPYESFNRPMFRFNDALDTYFLKPVATVYNKIMPKPLNKGIHNFFNNLGTVPTIANDFLQLNIYQGVSDLWRLTINTTIGIGGLFDVATRMGLPYYSNDFGLTLTNWGYKNSNYLVLPFFGPYTFRDAIGLPVDYYAFSVYPYIEPQGTRYAILGLGVIDKRANLLQYQAVFDATAIDKYVFLREAYKQNRAYQIEQNKHLGFNQRDKEEPATDLSPAEVASLDAAAPIQTYANTQPEEAVVADGNIKK